MSEVQFHKDGKVIAHLDKEGKIIGVEIPEEVFKISSMERMPTTISKEDNPRCPKGLKGCEKEIALTEVKYILTSHYRGVQCVLDSILINEDTLNIAYRHYKQLGQHTGRCNAFDPIHAKYQDSHSCVHCSLCEVCQNM